MSRISILAHAAKPPAIADNPCARRNMKAGSSPALQELARRVSSPFDRPPHFDVRRSMFVFWSQSARRKISVNSSAVSAIGFAFMLLAFAAFATMSSMCSRLIP